MQKWLLVVLFSLVGFLPACAIYRIDIQQGNILTQEMLDQLELGMSAQRVRFIMGTPIIQDTFHPQRWDYFYSLQAGWSTREYRRISLFFDDYDALIAIEGDVKPRSAERAPASGDSPSMDADKPLL